MLTKKVWVDALGHSQGLFPYEYPTLFSLGAALVAALIASTTDKSERGRRESAAFEAQFLQSERDLNSK